MSDPTTDDARRLVSELAAIAGDPTDVSAVLLEDLAGQPIRTALTLAATALYVIFTESIREPVLTPKEARNA